MDLFGEVVITQQDIRAWLMCVAGLDPEGYRAANYIRGYNVPDKIRRAKLAGVFEQLTLESRIYFVGGRSYA